MEKKKTYQYYRMLKKALKYLRAANKILKKLHESKLHASKKSFIKNAVSKHKTLVEILTFS